VDDEDAKAEAAAAAEAVVLAKAAAKHRQASSPSEQQRSSASTSSSSSSSSSSYLASPFRDDYSVMNDSELRPLGYDEVLAFLPTSHFFDDVTSPVGVSPADIVRLVETSKAGLRTLYHLQSMERDRCRFTSFEELIQATRGVERRERVDRELLFEALTISRKGLMSLDAVVVTPAQVRPLSCLFLGCFRLFQVIPLSFCVFG
jgi:hypothetical protein